MKNYRDDLGVVMMNLFGIVVGGIFVLGLVGLELVWVICDTIGSLRSKMVASTPLKPVPSNPPDPVVRTTRLLAVSKMSRDRMPTNVIMRGAVTYGTTLNLSFTS